MSLVLVTGGAKRLGKEISLSLAKKGYPLLIHYRNSKKEAQLLAETCMSFGVKADIVYGDFSTPKGTLDFLEKVSNREEKVKYLINNVGNMLECSASETSIEEWNLLFQVNLHSSFACIKYLLPEIKKAKGSIINIGVSGISSFRAECKRSAYTITKFSLFMLTKSLARELAPEEVNVNMVSPGQLDISVNKPDNLEVIPMKRLGTCTEITEVIHFLMDKKNNYITGQNIEVSGGLGL